MSTDPLRLSLVVLIIIVISRIHQHYPALNSTRPALLATGLVVIFAYLNSRLLAKGSVIRTWPGQVVAAFFVLACLSVPMGISMGNSGKFILDGYFKTIVFTFLLIAATRNVRDLYTLTWSVVISSAILSYFALFVFAPSDHGSYERLSDMYRYDANDVGAVLTAGLGFALLHVHASKGAARYTAFAVLIMMCAAIARTGSRGAMIGIVCAGLALLFLGRGISFGARLLATLVAATALTLAAPRGYWSQMATILSPQDDYNYTATDGRKQIAIRGIGYMMDYPILGIGIGNFTKAECTISPLAQSWTSSRPLRCVAPHNSYVEAGAELGVPGLLLFTTLILGGIAGPVALRRRLPLDWRNGDAEERYLFAATGYFPVVFAGYGASIFFLSFAWMDYTYMLAALLAGLYLAIDYKLRQNAAYPKPPDFGLVAKVNVRAWRRRVKALLPGPQRVSSVSDRIQSTSEEQ